MKNICDYMIIQRDAEGFGTAVFAGEYDVPEKAVVVACVMRETDNALIVPWQRCEVKGNEWKTEFRIPQGGLYRVEARLSPAEFHPCNHRYDWCTLIACAYHVGVGDIFIMAGQSNMSAYGRDPAYDPPQLGIHLFDNSGKWTIAAHPLNSVPNPIYANNDDTSGTSPALSFARVMSRQLNVPVGLVAAARGGSALESWNPAERDCYLYRALTEKAEAVGSFAGMIWAQGCNETVEDDEAETYLEKFEQTVTLWREKFGYFPIAACQINRHAWKEEDRERNWGLVREAQRQAALKIKGVFIVPTIDMYTVDGIHNGSGSCVIIGERLASVMLKGHYNLPGQFAPSIKSIRKLDSRTVLLTFHGEHMLRTMDDIATGINIEDENGMMNCTKIAVCNEGAKVTAERDIGENAVFHAYWQREVPSFFIRDIYGMPMLACYNVKIEN